jgi:hypothetical protein
VLVAALGDGLVEGERAAAPPLLLSPLPGPDPRREHVAGTHRAVVLEVLLAVQAGAGAILAPPSPLMHRPPAGPATVHDCSIDSWAMISSVMPHPHLPVQPAATGTSGAA